MGLLRSFGKKTSNAGKAMTIVAFFSVISKIVGMLRQVVLTNYFGATSVSDAYVLASSIPHTLYNLVAMAVGVGFTPIFQKILVNDGEKAADTFANKINSLLFTISTVFIIIIYLASEPVVRLFAGGASLETIQITMNFLRISAFTLYFIGINGVLTSYLKVKSHFTSVAIIGIPLSVVEIVSIVLAARYNVNILAIGIVGAALAQSVVLYLDARNSGYRINPNFDIIHDKNVQQIFIMSVPIFIGVCIDEVNVIIDRRIASSFDAGSISLLSYASTLVAIIHTVITVSINTVMYPRISESVAKGSEQATKQTLINGVKKALLLTLPAMFGIVIYSKPIIQLVYMRGKFTMEDVNLMAGVMSLYAVGLVGNAIRTLVQSYYYAHEKTKTTMYASFVGISANIVLNFLLSQWLGVVGLALATSISVLITAVILIFWLPKNVNIFLDRDFLKKAGAFLIAACVMALVGFAMYKLCISVGLTSAIMIIPMIAICVIVYFVLVVVLKGVNKQEVKQLLKRGG